MTQVSAVAALDEPNRRRLYEYVVRQPEPVSRDEAAAAVGTPRTTAAFHLDRLVEEGLLAVVSQRRGGRNGPGAGRPAKLYRRSDREISVTLPQRRYDLAGQLLAAAIDESERSGESARAVLDRLARRLGTDIGDAARTPAATHDPLAAVAQALEDNGFEPREVDGHLVLGNCPFHSLAHSHTELVCGMNLCLIEGLLRGLETTGLSARLNPMPQHCCVRIER